MSEILTIEKFFDSVSFWQKAYERSEAGQSELRDQIHELNQRNEALLAKLRDHDSSSPTNKRKMSATDNNANSAEMARKHTKPMKITPKTIFLITNDVDESTAEQGIQFLLTWLDMVTDLVTALCLKRQLFTVEKALQGRQNSSSTSNSLAIDAVTLCKSAEQKLIQVISTDQETSETKLVKAPDSEAVIKGVTMAFHLVHKVLHKLAGTRHGTEYQAQVTYYLVALFESTMTALTQHCTAISKRESTTRKPKARKGRKSTEHSQLTKHQPILAKNEASHLANLLCTMALSLDLTRTEDQDVMEGILFLLLTRMGKMLALHVFQDLRLPMGICPGMTFPEGLEAMTDEGLMPDEAELEARYLVRLLDRILNVELSQSAAEELIARQLVTNAKHRLQNTLVQAVFGSDEHVFREGMRHLQTPPPQVLGDEGVEQENFANWLAQEVWRIVGWDVLRTVFVSN